MKLFAPITPHITEYLYQELREKDMPESIHLVGVFKADKKKIDEELEKEMVYVKEITQQALSLREANKIRLRWPLKELVIVTESEEMFKESRSIIARFCNVREVKETKAKLKGNYADAEFDKYKLQLNLDADKELKEEWEFTELRRRIQALRKEAELMPDDKVKLVISCNDKEFLEKYAERIEKETNTKVHASGGKGEKLLEREFSIKLEK